MSKFELEVWDGVQRQLGVVLLDFREFQLTAPRVGNALWLCLTRWLPALAAERRKLVRLLRPCWLFAALDQQSLQGRDGLGWVEPLRAGLGAVENGVAAIEAERVLEFVEPLAACLLRLSSSTTPHGTSIARMRCSSTERARPFGADIELERSCCCLGLQPDSPLFGRDLAAQTRFLGPSPRENTKRSSRRPNRSRPFRAAAPDCGRSTRPWGVVGPRQAAAPSGSWSWTTSASFEQSAHGTTVEAAGDAPPPRAAPVDGSWPTWWCSVDPGLAGRPSPGGLARRSPCRGPSGPHDDVV